MKIVSFALIGNNADLIEAALASVADWVDACIVIDTGVTEVTAKKNYLEFPQLVAD